jgi:hypothetical protein
MVTASARSLPALTYAIDQDMLANMTCTCPPSRSTKFRGAAVSLRTGVCYSLGATNSPSMFCVLRSAKPPSTPFFETSDD